MKKLVHSKMDSKKSLYAVSLGCPKNLVDTEHMLGLLAKAGYVVTETPEKADVALINTCGFIEDAVKESIETIVELAALRREGRISRLVVAGCFVQRYGYKLKPQIPEVDLWLGTGQVASIDRCLEITGKDFWLNRPTHLPGHDTPRLRCTPFYTAYVRISEGCSHGCSFCIIPKLRGKLRSRPIESILLETESLAADGVKEINIVAQDITSYGSDLGIKWGIETLLEGLAQVKGIEWIRLLYGHPSGISERLLDVVEQVDKVCPYLDIPFQHVNERILRAMRRTGPESPRSLVEKIRKRSRAIAIRTTLMVGFPGEGEREFAELKEFVKWAELDHVGVFIFSREKGTRAARLCERVPREIAIRRRNEIMELQSEISLRKNREKIDRVFPVLIEGMSEETDLLLKGRTAQMAPDIDGQVYINKGEGVEGKIMNVRITQAYQYDLVGEIVG